MQKPIHIGRSPSLIRANKRIVGARSSFTLIELLVVTPPRKTQSVFSRGKSPSARASFTLIELLVVIAIIAVLAVVVVLTLNPAQLLKQARDSNRLSDLDTVNKALSIFQVDVIGGSLGVASTTYVSVPDPAATSTAGTNCNSLGLPSLPSGSVYHCAASSTYRSTNGLGWLPVNFQSISTGSPLGLLPVDPTNTTSTGLYYAYTPGGSWALAAKAEASKNIGKSAVAGRDGGYSSSYFEVGSNLSLALLMPQTLVRSTSTDDVKYFLNDDSLMGYWNFDEGSGTTANDVSGYDNNASFQGSSPSWAAGKLGSNALSFVGDASGSYVRASDATRFKTDELTISVWAKWTGSGDGWTDIFGRVAYGCCGAYQFNVRGFTGGAQFLTQADGWVRFCDLYTVLSANQWHLYTGTYSKSASLKKFYIDGAEAASASSCNNSINTYSLYIVAGVPGGDSWVLDDARIYNRALTSAEIAAIYNATK